MDLIDIEAIERTKQKLFKTYIPTQLLDALIKVKEEHDFSLKVLVEYLKTEKDIHISKSTLWRSMKKRSEEIGEVKDKPKTGIHAKEMPATEEVKPVLKKDESIVQGKDRFAQIEDVQSQINDFEKRDKEEPLNYKERGELAKLKILLKELLDE